MVNTLAFFIIMAMLGVEVWCGYSLYQIWKQHSNERSDARREALRPRAYKKVRDSWRIYRNREKLWDWLQK